MIGEGNNFVRTMQRLAAKGVSPSVVDGPGRPADVHRGARARDPAPARQRGGVRHVQRQQRRPADAWCDIAKEVFELSGRSPEDVTPVTTEEYYAGKDGLSPRPLRSVMDLAKIEATGFEPEDALVALRRYLSS